jgi:hypothetical protein
MRQRGAPLAPAPNNGGQQRQRHVVGREPASASWEITSERVHVPDPPRSHSEDLSSVWEIDITSDATTDIESPAPRRISETIPPFNYPPQQIQQQQQQHQQQMQQQQQHQQQQHQQQQKQQQQHLQQQQQHLQYQNGAPVESLKDDRNNARAFRLERTTRLEDFHTVFRTPHHVADNKYQAFLLGQAARRKGPMPIVNKVCFLQTCSGFSAVGAGFLFFIGFLLDTQPLYIKGALPMLVVQTDDGSRPVTQYIIPMSDSERLPIARTAYQCGFMYLLTVAICLLTLYPGWFQSQLYRRLQRYQDIPDSVSDSDSTLPTFHTVEDLEQGSPTRAYQTNNTLSRSFAGFKQWLAVRGWHPGQFQLRRGRRRQKHDQKKG